MPSDTLCHDTLATLLCAPIADSGYSLPVNLHALAACLRACSPYERDSETLTQTNKFLAYAAPFYASTIGAFLPLSVADALTHCGATSGKSLQANDLSTAQLIRYLQTAIKHHTANDPEYVARAYQSAAVSLIVACDPCALEHAVNACVIPLIVNYYATVASYT